MQSSKPAIEWRIAVAVLSASFLAALITVGAMLWPSRTANEQPEGSAAADALVAAIERGSSPAQVVEMFAAGGAIRSGVVYDRAGSVIARSGTASPTAEQVCRSLTGGGSICIEPVAAAQAVSDRAVRTAILAVAVALVAGGIIAAIATSLVRNGLRTVRGHLDDALRDPTYATRVAPAGGELGPLTSTMNQLLDQVQTRDVMLRRRTTEMEAANKELEAFAYAVSHDLRAPLGSINGFAQALEDEYGGPLDEHAKECIYWIRESAKQMHGLIEGLLHMSRLARAEMVRAEVDLSAIARHIASSLQRNDPSRNVTFVIPDGVTTNGDERLLRAVLENLIGNAWKFTSKIENARIELGVRYDDGHPAFYVRDNGAGFDPAHAAKMFRPFQRLHSEKEFGGTGIGLATVQKIVQRHGGTAWAEGEPGRGATLYFTTGSPHETYA